MANKLTCVIIDDNPLYIEQLQYYINLGKDIELLSSFNNPVEALEYLQNNAVDLLFLDIEMPEISGLSLVKLLDKAPMVIIISSHPEYAATSFDIAPLHFLVKPFTFEKYLEAVSRAKEQYVLINPKKPVIAESCFYNRDNFFFVKIDNQYIKLKHDDVLYIAGEKDYCKIITTNKHFLVLVNLKSIEAQLTSSFIRVHRSYLINTHAVRSLSNNDIDVNGHIIPLGEAFKDIVKEKIIGRTLISRSVKTD